MLRLLYIYILIIQFWHYTSVNVSLSYRFSASLLWPDVVILVILKILLGLVELPPPYWRLICVQYYFVVLNFIRQAVVKCTQIWQHICVCVCVCVCTHNSNMLLRSVSYNACSVISYQPQRNIYNKTKLLILFWLWFLQPGGFYGTLLYISQKYDVFCVIQSRFFPFRNFCLFSAFT